jgi:phosphatidylinositol-3-phosphatase
VSNYLSSRIPAFFVLCVITAAMGCSGSHIGNSSTSPQTAQPAQKSAPTITLAAQPATVTSGNSTVLTWMTAHATSVNIQGLGTFPASGSVNVKPSATTTYTAIASGPGGTAHSTAVVTVTSSTPPPPPGVPASNHVVLLVEENHMYSEVIGSGAMPYLSSLASKYGLAAQYYANTHPSIGNYFMLTTGQILTNNDSDCGTYSNDNMVRHLIATGKTWKSYAEGLPSVGYTGCDTGFYVKRHNPFSYFTDVVNSSTETANLVPFTQFAADLANNQLPQFSFIVPDVNDDAHNGTLGQADAWLQQNIAPLIANSAFQTDGILIVVFDEAETSDTQGGGGHVAAVVIGPKVKSGYVSTTNYQHQSTLKTLLEALSANTSLGAASSAPDMKEFF